MVTLNPYPVSRALTHWPRHTGAWSVWLDGDSSDTVSTFPQVYVSEVYVSARLASCPQATLFWDVVCHPGMYRPVTCSNMTWPTAKVHWQNPPTHAQSLTCIQSGVWKGLWLAVCPPPHLHLPWRSLGGNGTRHSLCPRWRSGYRPGDDTKHLKL